MTDETAGRIAEALERIANAQEAQVLIFQALLTEEDAPQSPVSKTILTQDGPLEFR